MKTVFIINPMAGQGTDTEKLIDKIKEVSLFLNEDIGLHVTSAPGDAECFAKEYCEIHGAARFIACGGDGTLGEVVSGASECPDAQIGVIPLGTGNDFCRNFAQSNDFLSIAAQIEGESTKCDVIRYRTTLNGKEKTGYCVNMFNIGFDCNVADMTASMKKKPFISGSLAYLLSIFVVLIKKKGAKLLIELDGEKKHCGPLLLTSVANGSYCGGGIKSNPLASIKDGFINVNIIYNISRLNFLTKLPFYMKGTHINLRKIENVIFTTKCKKAVITPLDGKMRLCADGEISDAGKTEFEIIKDGINFVIPAMKTQKKEKETILV